MMQCLSVFGAVQAAAQQPSSDTCRLPNSMKSKAGNSLFTDEQEQWLGDIMDQDLRKDFNEIEDPDGYLQKLGERLLAQLPPTGIHYRFVIIDSPELNSFGTTGGHIYIHRRMIAFARNEDELASVLAHEIGHVVDHHVALRISGWFRQLGIVSIGDRADVLKKWNQFKDNSARVKPHNEEKSEQEEQLIADRIALYAITRAGYDSARTIEFFDRLLQTKGKTGGFWSEFFGNTSPNTRRFGELVKNAEPLAKGCVAARTENLTEYTAWQKIIIGAHRVVARKDLPGLVRTVNLQPRLREDLFHLAFSPDGNYLLAQDESSVFVMTRQPAAALFRIDAPDAHTAQFSPDSKSVVFYDKELRVEKWDLASQKRTEMHQLTIPECFQSSLSPSGQYLGCVDYKFGLRLVDVNNDKIIYERKTFYTMSWWEYFQVFVRRTGDQPIRIFDLKFSPDDRYFVAGHRDSALAYDLKAGSEIHLPYRTQGLLSLTFAFVSPSQIASLGTTMSGFKLVRSEFPSGEKIDEFKFEADGWLSSTNSDNYLLVRPANKYPVGIVDLQQRNITLAFKSTAFAIWGGIFAGEQNSGEVALFNAADKKVAAKIQLPDSPLARSRVAGFSADGKWLAVSGNSRGALWKLDNGERVFFMRGFEGVLFDKDQLISKFPKRVPDISRVFQFDPATKGANKLYDFSDDAQHQNYRSFQSGDLLVILRPEKDKADLSSGRSIMEVRDVHNNKPLWERTLQKGQPGFFYTGKVLTVLISGWDGIRAAAKEDPVLKARLSSVDDKHDAYVLQALDALTGKLLGSVLVDTGKKSFHVLSAYTLGETVFVGDSENRTLVYSLKTGEEKGRLVGHIVAASGNGQKFLLENEDGAADLYDALTLQPATHFSFPSRIADADFVAGDSLLVLTADQTVYQLQMNEERATTTPAEAKR